MVRPRHGHWPADAAQDPGNPLRPQPGRLRHPPAEREGVGRAGGADLPADEEGDEARRVSAAAALRLRLLWLVQRAHPQHPPAQPGRPGRGLGRRLPPPEWPGGGNRLTDPEAYDFIESYAAYGRVGPKAFPAVLAYAGLSDPR